MILFYAVKLKKLFKKERDYPWKKPDSCPRCNSCRLWGHGFVQAIFDGFTRPLLIKLYRCPDCGCVIRLSPKGYFSRDDTVGCRYSAAYGPCFVKRIDLAVIKNDVHAGLTL